MNKKEKIMLKNYLLVAIRNIVKHKGSSLINILGLAIGMSACLLILYFVNYERSYDSFHENSDRIYRLRYERSDQEGQSVKFASCCPPMGLRIREQYPDVEKVARLFRRKSSVSYLDKMFIEENMYYAENEFFEIFKYKFISGDPLTGIKEPNKAFISNSTAKKYFGDKNPIGQIFSVDKKADYQITGVFEDIPSNSHLKFDIVLSYPSLINLYGKDVENSWGDSGWFTYLLLKQNADPKALEKKIPSLIDADFVEALKYYKLTCEFPLQPLNDIHLTSNFMQEYEVNGDRDTVNLLSIIALFIIIIAWVNYINLSTARSLTRAKEVGLRKVVGATRGQLITQLFFETIVINFVSIIIAFIIILIALPFFRQITGTPVEFSFWARYEFWSAIIILGTVGVLLSGLYPVIVLSSYQPASVLKGKFGNSPKGINLRKVLVGFQFVMAMGLLISTFAVFNQLMFMKNQDLGFSIDQKLIVRAPRVRDTSYGSQLQTFKEELLNKSGIINFCSTTDVPGRQAWWDAGGIHRKGSDDNKNYQIIGIDYNFANVFDLKFASGRNFSKEFPSDSSALILNETAAKWLGFESAEKAIGQEVDYWEKLYTVVGVLKDYHQQSLKQEFEPHIFRFLPQGRDVRGLFAMKLSSGNVNSTLQEIKKEYNRFFPGNPFEYFFLDEYFHEQYKGDEQFGKVFAIFAFLAIFVTSLGILGLSSFMVIQRKKEIGIRKVLGANVLQVVLLLTKDFQNLILIAFIVAVPISYFGIKYWLQSFAVKMSISLELFLIPLILTAVISGITICFHVIKAAINNPVESLRYE
jgi:putative ABC transport system permease protein